MRNEMMQVALCVHHEQSEAHYEQISSSVMNACAAQNTCFSTRADAPPLSVIALPV